MEFKTIGEGIEIISNDVSGLSDYVCDLRDDGRIVFERVENLELRIDDMQRKVNEMHDMIRKMFNDKY